MNLKTANRRRRKTSSDYRYSQWLKQFKLGAIVESCSLHPIRITRFNTKPYGGVVDGESLLDGSHQSCSIRHCGVDFLAPWEVKKKLKLWNSGGEKALIADYYGSKEAADAFIKTWR